jgi:DNA repair protein RadD
MLRPYQQKALELIRKEFTSGKKKVLLHLSTGGGKTVVFCEVMRGVVQKGTRCLLLVRGRKLVDQASKRLIRENTPHGVLMANHWLYRPYEKIQIASIDTLIARDIRPEAQFLVVDEAHLAGSDGFKTVIADYPDAYILSVTATPYMEKSIEHIAETTVRPVTHLELIKQGFLVKARYFAPTIPDLEGVKISSSTKDYVQDQLEKKMDTAQLTGDIVSHWKKLGENRPTICFAVTVRHSRHIVQSFMESGIQALHLDAQSSDYEREAAFRMLEKGICKVISNVGILGVGVDLPFVSCIVMARPTKSYCLYLQMLGRGTRPTENKTDFLVLDHADNVRKHGFIDEEPEGDLAGKFKGHKSKITICESCFVPYKIGAEKKCARCGDSSCGNCKEYGKCESCEKPICVDCEGKEDPKCCREIPRQIIHVEGDLSEIKNRHEEIITFVQEKKKIAEAYGYKEGWVFHQVKSKYGEAVAKRHVPYKGISPWLLRRTTNN